MICISIKGKNLSRAALSVSGSEGPRPLLILVSLCVGLFATPDIQALEYIWNKDSPMYTGDIEGSKEATGDPGTEEEAYSVTNPELDAQDEEPVSPYQGLENMEWDEYDGDQNGVYETSRLKLYIEGITPVSLQTRIHHYTDSWDNLEREYHSLASRGQPCIGELEKFLLDFSNSQVDKKLAESLIQAIASRGSESPHAIYINIYFENSYGEKPHLAGVQIWENWSAKSVTQKVSADNKCDVNQLVEDFIQKMQGYP